MNTAAKFLDLAFAFGAFLKLLRTVKFRAIIALKSTLKGKNSQKNDKLSVTIIQENFAHYLHISQKKVKAC